MSGLLDDMTELVDADIQRVDFVDKGANGRTFLLMKNAETESPSMLTADQVAELIKNDEAEGAAMTKPTDEVVKDDLDVTTPLVDGDNPLANDPGSPAWETVDAESAQKWITILGRAKYAVGLLAERELIEDASGDSDGQGNAWDLQDAQGAIDWAIGILAQYAAGEASDAELGEEVGKTLAAIAEVVKGLQADELSIAVVTGVAPLAKAGRVLSSANEAALRQAVDAIQKVLSGLPELPAVDDPDTVGKADAEVVKTEEPVDADGPRDFVAERIARIEAGRQAAAKSADVDTVEPVDAVVAKDDAADAADGADTKLQAVFDADGNLIGVVDPAEITAVDGASGADKTADETPAAPAAPVAAPAAPAVPAVPAVKTAEIEDTITESDAKLTLTKSDLETLINERIEAAVGEVRKEVDGLRSPARPGVARFGQYPFATEGRHDGSEVTKADDESVQALKRLAADGDSPAVRNAAADELTKLAANALTTIRATAPVPVKPPRR